MKILFAHEEPNMQLEQNHISQTNLSQKQAAVDEARKQVKCLSVKAFY